MLVPSVRGTPLAVAEEDLAVFTAGLEPPDEEAAKAVVGNAWKSLDGITAMEALGRVSEAVHDSLCHGPLPRDDFHQALRERLPSELVVVQGLRQPPRPPPRCGALPVSAACW